MKREDDRRAVEERVAAVKQRLIGATGQARELGVFERGGVREHVWFHHDQATGLYEFRVPDSKQRFRTVLLEIQSGQLFWPDKYARVDREQFDPQGNWNYSVSYKGELDARWYGELGEAVQRHLDRLISEAEKARKPSRWPWGRGGAGAG